MLICDEVDRYPPSAGDEGDPISLAQKRTTTFFNRKTVLTSTPTLKGESRIERAFEQSDQRHYFVPCPHCGTMQRLEWGGKESPNGLKWKTDDKGQHFPETTVYVCVEGCIIEERAKPRMIENGEWRASRPFAGIAGFHIWAAYSLHANSSWANLVREWLDAKGDPLSRQTFVNLVLGLPYEDRGTHALNEKTLAQRAEKWPAEVPFGVAVLTAGLDVQDDRVEIEVVGWGRNEERWSIEHEVVEGDPGGPALWAEVDAFLRRTWARDDGRPFAIHAACIDSGGHFTEAVYTFSKARLGRRIWAIKGEAARGGRRSPVWPVKRPSARNRQAFRPVIIGVNAAKDVIRSRLHLDPPRAGEAVAGYMHFPDDRDLGYFAQLVSERSVMKQAGGQRYRVWELGAGRTNEALDLAVYSYAALCGLLHFGLKLNQRADDMNALHVAPPPPAAPGAPRPAAPMQPAAAPAAPAAGERRSLLSRFA